MRKLLLVFFIAPIFSQCTSSDKIPPDVLSIDKMKGTVWDLMKASELALHDTIHHKEINLMDDETTLFQKIFQLHRIDKNTFYKSYDFYLKNPQWNAILLDSVNVMATRDRNEMYMHQQQLHPLPKISAKNLKKPTHEK
jgi:hypothetical protein